MNWFKNIFKKKEDRYTKNVRTLYDFFMRFYLSERDRVAMLGYIRENLSCTDFDRKPSGKIMRRYMLNYDSNLMAWYLLEKYFDNKIQIKDELQPKP